MLRATWAIVIVAIALASTALAAACITLSIALLRHGLWLIADSRRRARLSGRLLQLDAAERRAKGASELREPQHVRKVTGR